MQKEDYSRSNSPYSTQAGLHYPKDFREHQAKTKKGSVWKRKTIKIKSSEQSGEAKPFSSSCNRLAASRT
jgi:hypothetical protein